MPQRSDLPPYPLEKVLDVKNRRVEEAEKVVKEKRKALEAEQEKLKQREAERDKVQEHYGEKKKQFRETLDAGTTSPKIEQMKNYLTVVQEKLALEEKKVKDQQKQVELAEKNLELAKNDLKQRRHEVDKIETHREEWTKETMKELQIFETREEDELGSTMYLSKFMQRKASR